MTNRTEMVILKQYTFWRKYSGAINSIRKGKCKDKVSGILLLGAGQFQFLDNLYLTESFLKSRPFLIDLDKFALISTKLLQYKLS